MSERLKLAMEKYPDCLDCQKENANGGHGYTLCSKHWHQENPPRVHTSTELAQAIATAHEQWIVAIGAEGLDRHIPIKVENYVRWFEGSVTCHHPEELSQAEARGVQRGLQMAGQHFPFYDSDNEDNPVPWACSCGQSFNDGTVWEDHVRTIAPASQPTVDHAKEGEK